MTKRKLFTIAVGAVMSLPSFNAMAEGPTVFGRLDIGHTRVDDDSAADTYWDLKSYASRIGIKGEMETDSDVKVIYHYELEINPTENDISDSNDDDFLKARNQFVGLKSDRMGTLKLGRMDTPLKTSQGKVDIFGDHNADIKNIMEGENRRGDTVNYTTPKLSGFQGSVSLIAGEEGGVEDGENGLADGSSLSVSYSVDGIYAAFGYDSEVNDYDLARLTLAAKMGDFGGGILFQTGEESTGADPSDPSDHTGFVLSGYTKMGVNKLKIQYGQSEDKTSASKTEQDLLALGFDHSLSKPTTLFAEYTMIGTDDGASDTDVNSMSFGVRHKF